MTDPAKPGQFLPKTRAVIGALALSAVAAVSAGSADSASDIVIADCEAFTGRWNALLREAMPGHPALTLGPDSAGQPAMQPISGTRGVEGRLRCQEGKFVRLELAEAAGATPGEHLQSWLAYASAALRGIDTELDAAEASGTIEALRAESGPSRPGVSTFGPYEVSVTRAEGRHGFLLEFPEN